MRPRTPLRPIIVLAVTALIATGAAAPAPAAARPAPVAHETPAPGHGALDPVVRLAAQRLLVVDQVALAKWSLGLPVDDPARERQVTATVTTEARALGVDPNQVARFFRDQFAAAGDVEHALVDRWNADPSSAPPAEADPDTYRSALDSLDDRLVHALAETAAARADGLCGLRVGLEAAQVSAELRLDTTHRTALNRSLDSVCG